MYLNLTNWKTNVGFLKENIETILFAVEIVHRKQMKYFWSILFESVSHYDQYL